MVAQHAGPGFHRQARGALDLALALLNSPEASYAPSAAGVRAACGRLVNAATAAIGPELDPEGAPFARASALIVAVRDGGDTGGGGGGGGGSGGGSRRGEGSGRSGSGGAEEDDDDGGCGGGGGGGGELDAACQLEAALFLQQLALFAPRAAPPARLVPRLRPVLAAGQPALRRAAAATLRHLCERDASAVAAAASSSSSSAAASAAASSSSSGGWGGGRGRGGGSLEADLLALLAGEGCTPPNS